MVDNDIRQAAQELLSTEVDVSGAPLHHALRAMENGQLEFLNIHPRDAQFLRRGLEALSEGRSPTPPQKMALINFSYVLDRLSNFLQHKIDRVTDIAILGAHYFPCEVEKAQEAIANQGKKSSFVTYASEYITPP